MFNQPVNAMDGTLAELLITGKKKMKTNVKKPIYRAKVPINNEFKRTRIA